MARHRPDVPSSCSDSSWMWPGVARCLPSLAPQLAPRNLISTANVRTVEYSSGSRSEDSSQRPNLAAPAVIITPELAATSMAWVTAAGYLRELPQPPRRRKSQSSCWAGTGDVRTRPTSHQEDRRTGQLIVLVRPGIYPAITASGRYRRIRARACFRIRSLWGCSAEMILAWIAGT